MSDYSFVLAGALAGGFINGLAGFGTALFSLGLFLAVLPPEQAVAIVLSLSVFTGAQGLFLVRREILAQPRRLFRFSAPALLGIPLGVHSLGYVDGALLRLTVAVFLILYGGFFAFRRNLPTIAVSTVKTDVFVGFLGGILGGLAGLSGALPTMWCSLRPWPKEELRAVLQPYNFLVLIISATLLALRGAYNADTLILIAFALPASLIAAQIGIRVFKSLSDTVFKRLLIFLCLLAGIVLIFTS